MGFILSPEGRSEWNATFNLADDDNPLTTGAILKDIASSGVAECSSGKAAEAAKPLG